MKLAGLSLIFGSVILVSCGGGSASGPPIQNPPPNNGPASGSEFLYQVSVTADIQVSTLNSSTGSLSALTDAAPDVIVENLGLPPVATPSGKFLYVQGFDQDPMTQPPVSPVNAIYCFSITGSEGELTSLSGSPFISSNLLDPSVFIGPTASGMVMDGKGRFLFLSDFGSSNSSGQQINSIRPYTITSDTGALQNGPVLSSSTVAWYVQAIDPTNRYLYAWVLLPTSIGVSVFSIDPSTAALTEIPGSPFPVTDTSVYLEYNVRVSASPLGDFVFVSVFTNAGGSEVFAFSADPTTGALTATSASPFPIGNAVASILHPSGKFIYATLPSATDPSLSGYAVDPTSGSISSTPVSSVSTSSYHGSTLIDPDGNVLVFNDSDNTASTYLIDGSTGALSNVAGSPFGVALQWESALIVRIP